jgi:hypothetical protein
MVLVQLHGRLRQVRETRRIIRGSSTKYVSLGPCTETKHNCMEILIATDTASVQLLFNIFATGTETFVIPWDQLLYTVRRSLPPGIGTTVFWCQLLRHPPRAQFP